MNKENIPVITDRKKLYDKCENMEQLFDKYYLPLLDKHYSKTYELQQENQELKLELSGYRQAILEDKDMLGLKEESEALKKQLEEYKYSHSCSFVDTCKNVKIANYNQQKEFIQYLENMLDNENDIFSVVRVKDILSKYEEIIGSEVNENKSKNN